MNQIEENTDVRQREDEGYRRWFVNSYFDIIIWYDKKEGEIIGFQFCFSRNDKEKAYTWTKEYSSSHIVSDTYYEKNTLSLSTGILKGDGGSIPDAVLSRFLNELKKLDRMIVELIINNISEYNTKRKVKDT